MPLDIPVTINRHLSRVPTFSEAIASIDSAVVPSLLGGDANGLYRFEIHNGMRLWHSVAFGYGSSKHPSCLQLTTRYTDFFPFITGPYAIRVRSLRQENALNDAEVGLASPRIEKSTSSLNFKSVDVAVPAISQMPHESEPDKLRRLCGPTCLLMICKYFGIRVEMRGITQLSFNPASSGFGVWPQMIAAANQLGLSGAVIFVDSIPDLFDLLAGGTPVVASLRFSDGGLPDFPFGVTKGHMVVVRGMFDNRVVVNDPAHRIAVIRQYPIESFMRVWRNSRPEIGHSVGLVFWKRSCA